ncbi:MAG: hypothetical protein AAGD12_14905, partial [Pseudomonadota bacterium]
MREGSTAEASTGAAVFAPQEGPRLFALPPGANFIPALCDGLARRFDGLAPDEIARAELWLNATRAVQLAQPALARALARRRSGASLLPRLRAVTDLAGHPDAPLLARPVSALRRRLRLSELVGRYLAARPGTAPPAARFELAARLADLIDELDEAGVDPQALDRLDVGQHAAHWADARAFLGIIVEAWPQIRCEEEAGRPDPLARQRMAVEGLAERWAAAPPQTPVILAGSTGSRPLTAQMMALVAQLPQGAVVLPGFDAGLPDRAWATMGPEHPQAAFAGLFARLGCAPDAVQEWVGADTPGTAAATAGPVRGGIVRAAMVQTGLISGERDHPDSQSLGADGRGADGRGADRSEPESAQPGNTTSSNTTSSKTAPGNTALGDAEPGNTAQGNADPGGGTANAVDASGPDLARAEPGAVEPDSGPANARPKTVEAASPQPLR